MYGFKHMEVVVARSSLCLLSSACNKKEKSLPDRSYENLLSDQRNGLPRGHYLKKI